MAKKKCRDCGITEGNLIGFLPSRPGKRRFYLCPKCWQKDLDNSGSTYSEIMGWE